SSAPSSRPTTLSISLSLAVSMITGTFDFSRSDRQTSLPGRPGSIRSSSTRSAPVRSKVSSASGPDEQTATSKPSLRSRYEMASLNDSSSSTTSTRVTSLPPGGSRHGRGGAVHDDGTDSEREPEGEGRPRTLRAHHCHLSSVGGGDVLDDGQAEACAAGGTRPRGVNAVEPLEDPFQVPLGDPDPLVGHADLDRVIGGLPRRDVNPGLVRAVRDGVLQKIAQRGDQQV